MPDRRDFRFYCTCAPVAQEVLQGRRELEHRLSLDLALWDSFMSVLRLSDPVPFDLYLEAAEIYRLGRRKGITIRSSNDCLIAAIAIKNRVPVWHFDRDFDSIARFTALEVKSS
ncbi:MAG: PIN domain-containing protein [Bryobacteraceae bacterium]|nr:PIN domain-containing protein [Bryobacteraceae bacterium]